MKSFSAFNGLLTPKVSYRFRVEFDSITNEPRDDARLTCEVKSIKLPTMPFLQVGREFTHPEDILITFSDDDRNFVHSILANHRTLCLNSPKSEYSFNTIISLIDATGEKTLIQYVAYGCFFNNMQYSKFDYASNLPIQIDTSICSDIIKRTI